jgi:hypothetical protein
MRWIAGALFVFAAAWSAEQASAADLGDASVTTQRGQRLRIAVPYGNAPGQRLSALRFWVESVSVPAGFKAPAPDSFTVLKPVNRNVVYLQSRDRFDAPAIQLVLRVAGDNETSATYNLAVPAARLVPVAEQAPAAPTAVKAPMRKTKTKVKRKRTDTTAAPAAKESPMIRDRTAAAIGRPQ